MSKKFNMQNLKKEPSKKLLENSPGSSEESKPGKVKPPKAKLGRKTLPEDEKLEKKITVNLTKAEYKTLENKSEEMLGIKLPQLVRALLKRHKEI